MKPTFLHLALCHEAIISEVFHAVCVSPQAVEAVVAGVFVEQEIFDRVLAAFNALAGTTYRQEDIRDVCILNKDFITSSHPDETTC